jgi:hypothetical protein
MNDLPLLLGVGLGGIGLGTIIAAGYLYSNQDREVLKNSAAGIVQKMTPDQLSQKSINIRTQNIMAENQERDEKSRKNNDKIKNLESLYTDIQSLDKLIRTINDKLEDKSISEEDRVNLENERAPLLASARKIEKEIKKYDEDLRQLAKNNISFKQDASLIKDPVTKEPDIQKPDIQEPNIQEPNIQEPNIQEPDIQEPDIQEPNIQEPDIQEPDIQEPDIQEPDIQEPIIQEPEEEDFQSKTPEDDLNMPIERSDSFSSNPPTGGSKYFTLTYTPKKSTKKRKSLTKRNKLNKRKTKRNKRKTKRN